MQYEHDDGLRSTTRRARVVKVDDTKSQQRIDLRGLKNEKPIKIWRPQEFGSTSVPPKDCDGVMAQMGSRSDRTLYYDGGHEKYRPKNTPEGCKAIFNMHGDIIRVFKDSSDVVHQKKVNIRVGHGYNAGDNGEGKDSPTANGKPDDTSNKDTKTISAVFDGTNIVITFENAKVTWNEKSLTTQFDDTSIKQESGLITHTAPHVVIVSNRVDLGGTGGEPVGLCGGGCATRVFAV